ncbi:hypothetical protein GTY65_34040 [Streptomyces sp. SID8379]|uniref:hypothetical protein n=1 Tax=unclassified Streptomyces TaxID=2593676 RepID=UPI00037AEE48|nr:MULTISPECIES: hypothetical protein [unclassified Streptomyces]MYW69058.1 hypothetical protein [Streptomyces sp. SID8379]
MARKRKQPEPALEDKDERKIHYPPLANGIDYLSDVVERLGRKEGQPPSDRDLKYAVLHLQAAVEVLLKARLYEEHWTLVVSMVSKVNRVDFEGGDFDSASHHEVIRRLVEVVGIDISAADKAAVLGLAKMRNRLQHWGLTDSANSVLTSAATVLDFLVRFIDQHLDVDEDAEAEIADIREGLLRAQSYIDSRMTRLRESVLKGHAQLTVQCPDCRQYALVVDGVENMCHFCPRSWSDPSELASLYDSHFVVSSDPGESYEDTLVVCPACEDWPATLCLEAETVASDGPVPLCFICATILTDLDTCMRCCRLFIPVVEEALCSDCFADLG